MLQDIRSVKLSRRSFLVTTGAFGVAVAFGSLPDAAFAAVGGLAVVLLAHTIAALVHSAINTTGH